MMPLNNEQLCTTSVNRDFDILTFPFATYIMYFHLSCSTTHFGTTCKVQLKRVSILQFCQRLAMILLTCEQFETYNQEELAHQFYVMW